MRGEGGGFACKLRGTCGIRVALFQVGKHGICEYGGWVVLELYACLTSVLVCFEVGFRDFS